MGLAASYAVAIRRPLPSWELRLTEAINDVPDAVGSALYPVMQLGTLGGPIVVAIAIAIFKRDLVLSAAVVITGIVTWFAAKGVKRLVERDRPLTYLPEIIVREGDGTGLGYISGHSAVAASAADHGHGGDPDGDGVRLRPPSQLSSASRASCTVCTFLQTSSADGASACCSGSGRSLWQAWSGHRRPLRDARPRVTCRRDDPEGQARARRPTWPGRRSQPARRLVRPQVVSTA